MPITRDEFERAQIERAPGELSQRIVAFLQRDSSHAFTVDEIHKGIGLDISKQPIPWDLALLCTVAIAVIAVNDALKELVRKRAVVKRTIDGKDYYSIA